MIFTRHVIEGVTTPVTICPLGDIQWNGSREELAYDTLRSHVAHCLKLPNPRFIGMGDYVDFASPSNRAAISAARLYAGPRKVLSDKALDLALDCHGHFLKETKGKWLGMLSGHHFFPIQTGGNTDIRLCEMLDAPYLGAGVAVIRLEFRQKTHTQVVTLWAAHGKGYGRSAARPLDMLQQISSDYDGVDVFLMGHHTKKGKVDKQRMYPVFPSKGEPRLGHRSVHLVATGGWSKGYMEGSTTYVEDGLMSPVVLGAPIIHVRPAWRRTTKSGNDVWEPNITVET